jgi:hypothetical protein
MHNPTFDGIQRRDAKPFPGGGTQQMAQVARKPNTGIRTDKVATISVSSKPQHQKRQGPLTITEALQTQPVST